MKFTEILSDAITYPFSDLKASLKLFVPNLILLILSIIITFTMNVSVFFGTSGFYLNMYEFVRNYDLNYYLYMLVIVTVLNIVYYTVNLGIVNQVVTNTLNDERKIPELNLKVFIKKGYKLFIINLIILFILYMIYRLVTHDTTIIEGIRIIFIFFVPAIFGILAQSDSLKDSINPMNIWKKTKEIGFINVWLFAAIMWLVALLLELLLYFGGIIISFIVLFFVELIVARISGLIYLNRSTED